MSRLITQMAIAETIIYGQTDTGFFEGQKAKFDPGLN